MKSYSTTERRRARVLGAAALAMCVLAGATASVSAPQTIVVTMANMSYGQVPVSVKVGDTIHWVNADSVAHTVTARDKSFDLRLNPGKSADMTLTKEGVFPFYCIYHSTMRGTLKVTAK